MKLVHVKTWFYRSSGHLAEFVIRVSLLLLCLFGGCYIACCVFGRHEVLLRFLKSDRDEFSSVVVIMIYPMEDLKQVENIISHHELMTRLAGMLST
jgi:hypothetical protein